MPGSSPACKVRNSQVANVLVKTVAQVMSQTSALATLAFHLCRSEECQSMPKCGCGTTNVETSPESQLFAGPVIGIFCSGLNAYCMQTGPLFLRISGSSGVLKAFLLERNRQLSCNPKKKKKKKKEGSYLGPCPSASLSTPQKSAVHHHCILPNHGESWK